MLDSVMECAVVCVLCMYILSEKTHSVINMNSEMSYVVQCASVAIFSEPAFKTSVVQAT